MAMKRSLDSFKKESYDLINFVMQKRLWYSRMGTSDSFNDRLYVFYLILKVPLMVVMMIVGLLGSYYYTEKMGLNDGSLCYAIMGVYMVGQQAVYLISSEELDALMIAIDERFSAHKEPFMAKIREEYIDNFMWKIVNIMVTYNRVNIFICLCAPLFWDVVLFHILEIVDIPVVAPSLVSSYMTESPSALRIYVIHFIGCWLIKESYDSLEGTTGIYAILSSHVVSEILILKEMIKKTDFSGDATLARLKLKNIIQEHVELIKLHRQFVKWIGLPLAILTVSGVVTFITILYLVITTTETHLFIQYSILAVVYSFGISMYCLVGQYLEDKVEELYTQICELPWYEYEPKVQKDLLMLVRQSGVRLVTDCHGIVKINIEWLSTVMNLTYSFVTVLLKMTSER